MLWFALLTLFAARQCAAADIDRSNCVDIGAGHGIEASCPAGYVAVGACGSGRNLDCQGSSVLLKCCAVVTVPEEENKMACQSFDGNHGTNVDCPENTQVNALCGSGGQADCGPDIYHRVMCCDENNLTTGPVAECLEIRGNYGDFSLCPDTDVMVGYCGSGRNADCEGESYTIVTCCPYS